MNTGKILTLLALSCLSIDGQAEVGYAQIPDYSGTTTSSAIASNQSFLHENLGFNPNVTGSTNTLTQAIANAFGIGNISGGELAIVDNVYDPRCVAYLQYNQGSNGSQNLTANTINLNCR